MSKVTEIPDHIDQKNVIKARDLLYRLMIRLNTSFLNIFITKAKNVVRNQYIIIIFFLFSQLFYDGHQQLAVGLSAIAQPDPPCPPSDRLLHIALLGLQHEPDRSAKQQLSALTGAISTQEAAAGPGLGKISIETD